MLAETEWYAVFNWSWLLLNGFVLSKRMLEYGLRPVTVVKGNNSNRRNYRELRDLLPSTRLRNTTDE
jgi:hypothetical protein